MAHFASDGTIELYINSKQDKAFTSDTSANFSVFFKENIQLNNTHHEITLARACVPNTMPQFNTDQRAFSVQQESQSAESLVIDHTRIFDSVVTLCTALQTQLNALTDVDVVVEQDANTKRTKITNNSAGYLDLLRGGNPAFWDKLGFGKSQETSEGVIRIASGGASVLSNEMTLLVATQRVYICTQSIFNNSKTTGDANQNIIGSVDMSSAFGSYNVFEQNYAYWHTFNPVNDISVMKFYILDDRFVPIPELYGGTINMSLILRHKPQA